MKGNVIVLTSEDKLYIKVTDPCLLPNQIVPQPLAAIDYWIKDPAASITINPFLDTTTRDYGNLASPPAPFATGDNLCGPKTYQLYRTYPDRFSA